MQGYSYACGCECVHAHLAFHMCTLPSLWESDAQWENFNPIYWPFWVVKGKRGVGSIHTCSLFPLKRWLEDDRDEIEEEYCPLPGALFTMHSIHSLRSPLGTAATGMKNSIAGGHGAGSAID